VSTIATIKATCSAQSKPQSERVHFLTRLKHFFCEKDSAINLAVFRFVLFSMIFLHVNTGHFVGLAEVPIDLRVIPFGSNGLVELVGINHTLVWFMCVVCKLACIAAALGLFTRLSTIAAAVTAIYVLLIPECFGKVDHDHHMVWFAALLAASPCGHALSIDALLARRKRPSNACYAVPEQAVCYGLPLRFVWLLMGVIYFFPGLSKLTLEGIQWFNGAALVASLHNQWARLSWLPAFRIDRYSILCMAGGSATILFELSFLFLILFRRTRKVAAFAGLFFHAMTCLFLRIPDLISWQTFLSQTFASLIACYVSFFDWSRIFYSLQDMRRVTASAPSYCISAKESKLWLASTSFVAVVLLLGSITFGAIAKTNAWPFACYPTFTNKHETFKRYSIVLADDCGHEKAIEIKGRWVFYAPVKEGASEQNRRILKALFQIAPVQTKTGWTKQRLYLETRPTNPDRWGQVDRQLMAESALTPAS